MEYEPWSYIPLHVPQLAFSHKKVMANTSEVWQTVRALADQMDGMIPCDVVAFLEAHPDIRGDLALVILLARIKEPRCIKYVVQEFRRHGDRPYVASDLRGWLRGVVTDVANRPPPREYELRQTSIVGAARLNGSQKVSLDLGIVTKATEGASRSLPNGIAEGVLRLQRGGRRRPVPRGTPAGDDSLGRPPR